tara:strand:+ start:1443 stop:2366 length:924 start_codon:yes stop_codon:yes gene_type:complete
MEINKEKRHIKSVEETDTEIIITFGKSEDVEELQPEDESGLDRGSFVSWQNEGEERSHGVVTDIAEDGYYVERYSYNSKEEAFTRSTPPEQDLLPLECLKVIEGAEIRSIHEIKEHRTYDGELKADNESRTVEGYASVFNSMSEDLGGFREIIKPGAFTNAMNDDVRALYNHDSNYLLARTASGTLELWQDDKGLGYRFEMPNTSYGNDMLELFRRGDLSQSSFGFTVEKDSWKLENGQQVRYIESVSSLFDVSAVVYPAYVSSSSGLRSTEAPEAEVATKDATEEQKEEVNYNLYNALIKLAKDEC